jgi:hypothetical protein
LKNLGLQKTYSGEIPRPSTEVFLHENEKIILAGTPWGGGEVLRSFDENIKEFLSAAIGDQEVTSPFARLPSLSSAENNLRSALLIANEAAFQKCNKESYTSGAEALILHFHGPEVAWVQIGQPNLLLVRGGKLYPLQVALDLACDFQNSSPIPSKLVGLERAWDLEVRSLVLEDKDSLILLARSFIPSTFFSHAYKGDTSKTVETLFELAVKDNNKLPFWISILN